MAGYSVAQFVQDVRKTATTDEILADDLAMHKGLPTRSDITKVETRLQCTLPKVMVDLMLAMEISGAQLGHIVFGLGGFRFPESLIEQNLKVDDPEFIRDRGLLSFGLDVNSASPLCIPRESRSADAGPPVLVLEHETGKVIGPIYDDFLKLLEGQSFLASVWGQDASIIKQGMRRILGSTLKGPAGDYWAEFFETC